MRGPHAHMNLTSVAKISNDVTDVTSAFQGIKLCVEVAVCIGKYDGQFSQPHNTNDQQPPSNVIISFTIAQTLKRILKSTRTEGAKRHGSLAASDTDKSVRLVQIELGGATFARDRPLFSPSGLLFGPSQGQGRPSLTPVGFWLRHVAPSQARFFPLCPIPWMQAVLVAKRLKHEKNVMMMSHPALGSQLPQPPQNCPSVAELKLTCHLQTHCPAS